mmetsp:Transcript_121071/g.196980  ORF Transcript_121071/g.196980 Transcript_121071/m.196980 type:complete len:522 (+) Transcript_121071:99-1664(+)
MGFRDRTPLLPKTREPLISGRWLFVVLVCCSGLGLLSFTLHRSMAVRQKALRQQLETKNVVTQLQDRAFQAQIIQNGLEFLPELQSDLFEQCNPSLPRSELSGVRHDQVLSPVGLHCGRQEAEAIRHALDKWSFGYSAVYMDLANAHDPDPYQFLPYMQRVLASQNHTALSRMLHTLKLALQAKQESAELQTLVKFFSWGLPVPGDELRRILGYEASKALERCAILAPCTWYPTMLTSTVMIHPVPHTNAMVASDWPKLHDVEKQQEDLVPIVTLEAYGLAHNAPAAKDKRVLDISSGNGLQSILAAQRGAAAVTFLEQSLRRVHFARFNAWLNRVGTTVRAVHGSLETLPKRVAGGLDLILANPSFGPVLYPPPQTWSSPNDGEEAFQKVFSLSHALLAPGGALVALTDVPNPERFGEHLCKDLNVRGMSGSIVFDGPPETTQHFAARRARLGVQEKVERNLEAYGIHTVASSIIFGWRMTGDECGKFSSYSVANALSYSLDATKERACSHSPWGCPVHA